MCWVAGLKQAIFRNAEPELMAMENEGNWGGNFSYRGLTVPSDCKGELKYCIYFQQLCFKPAQCGLRWLKGFICCWHCTLWHCTLSESEKPDMWGLSLGMCGHVYLYWWETYKRTCSSKKVFGVWPVISLHVPGIHTIQWRKESEHTITVCLLFYSIIFYSVSI